MTNIIENFNTKIKVKYSIDRVSNGNNGVEHRVLGREVGFYCSVFDRFKDIVESDVHEVDGFSYYMDEIIRELREGKFFGVNGKRLQKQVKHLGNFWEEMGVSRDWVVEQGDASGLVDKFEGIIQKNHFWLNKRWYGQEAEEMEDPVLTFWLMAEMYAMNLVNKTGNELAGRQFLGAVEEKLDHEGRLSSLRLTHENGKKPFSENGHHREWLGHRPIAENPLAGLLGEYKKNLEDARDWIDENPEEMIKMLRILDEVIYRLMKSNQPAAVELRQELGGAKLEKVWDWLGGDSGLFPRFNEARARKRIFEPFIKTGRMVMGRLYAGDIGDTTHMGNKKKVFMVMMESYGAYLAVLHDKRGWEAEEFVRKFIEAVKEDVRDEKGWWRKIILSVREKVKEVVYRVPSRKVLRQTIGDPDLLFLTDYREPVIGGRVSKNYFEPVNNKFPVYEWVESSMDKGKYMDAAKRLIGRLDRNDIEKLENMPWKLGNHFGSIKVGLMMLTERILGGLRQLKVLKPEGKYLTDREAGLYYRGGFDDKSVKIMLYMAMARHVLERSVKPGQGLTREVREEVNGYLIKMNEVIKGLPGGIETFKKAEIYEGVRGQLQETYRLMK